MPIYEFYCADCHAIFNFLSRRVELNKRPACPRCGRPELERRFSRFAVSRGRAEPGEGPELSGDFDEAKMEQVLGEMANQPEGLDEDDPRQMARFLRKVHEATGMPLAGPMEEAIRRMEAGEDPEQIEEEMGDLLEGDFPPSEGGSGLRQWSQRFRPPEVDENLYDL